MLDYSESSDSDNLNHPAQLYMDLIEEPIKLGKILNKAPPPTHPIGTHYKSNPFGLKGRSALEKSFPTGRTSLRYLNADLQPDGDHQAEDKTDAANEFKSAQQDEKEPFLGENKIQSVR